MTDLYGIDNDKATKTLLQSSRSQARSAIRLVLRALVTAIACGGVVLLVDRAGWGRIWLLLSLIIICFGSALLFGIWDRQAEQKSLSMMLGSLGRCRKCGRDLRGVESGICPECGTCRE